MKNARVLLWIEKVILRTPLYATESKVTKVNIKDRVSYGTFHCRM